MGQHSQQSKTWQRLHEEVESKVAELGENLRVGHQDASGQIEA